MAGENLDYGLIDKLCEGVQWGMQSKKYKGFRGMANVTPQDNDILAMKEIPRHRKAARDDYICRLARKGIFFRSPNIDYNKM
jgi:hypothetical protein